MEKLCFGCMKMKQNTPVCEHCGFDERIENLPHQLPKGTLLQNQYLVGRVLGQGGFGITYMGWDQHLSIPVAIKEYFPGGVVQRHTQLSTKVFCINGEAPEMFAKHRDRFLKEARTLAQLKDIPEIVQVKSFFASNDTAYIAMECIQGVTLKAHLKNMGRPMTEEEALDIMEPVVKALQKVHDHGLIHRDISPDNIMLPETGGIKLIDFGTVRYLDDSAKSKSTEAVLKPGFAPMEQYITRGNLGAWSDVYALCATFHYLLTGKVPEEAMARLDSDGTLPLLRNRQGLSSRLVEVLEKGMQVRISDRIQSAEELYQLLYCEKTLKVAKTMRLETTELPQTEKAAPAPKKRTMLLPLLIALLVALVCAGGWVLRKPQAEPIVQQSAATLPASQESPEDSSYLTEEESYQEAAALAERGEYAAAAIAFAKLDDYRDSRARSFETWALVPNRQTISFYYFSDPSGDTFYDMICAIREDGSVAADFIFSDALPEEINADDIVDHYQGIVSIHGAIGLKHDGTLALPDNIYKFDSIRDWSDIAAIASYEYPMGSFDYYLYVGLKTDGTVTAAGSIPVSELQLDRWSDIQAIACEMNMVVGLRKDGTVVAAGRSAPDSKSLESWRDIVDIAVGPGQILGLRSDGTVLAAGENTNNVLNLVNEWQWKNVTSLSDGPYGLKQDGTIVSGCDGGGNHRGNVYGWNDLVAVTCNQWQTAGLKKDGSLVFTADGWGFYAKAHTWGDILLPDQLIADPITQYEYADAWEQEGEYGKAAVIFGSLGHYKDSYERSLSLWRKITPHKTISAGEGCTAMVRADGTVVAPSVSDQTQYAVSGWRDILSVSAGSSFTSGLRNDGAVLVTQFGPDVNSNEWADLVAIDSSSANILGLKADGSVVAAGSNQNGACDVGEWSDIVAICSSSHSVGLKMDGTVVAAGANLMGQCDVEAWTDIVMITSAPGITAGVKADGTAVVTGSNFGYDISSWRNLVAVEAASGDLLLGLKADGTVVLAGNDRGGTIDVSEWSDIVAISANSGYVLGLKSDGTMVSSGEGTYGETRGKLPTGVRIPE